MSSLVPSHAKLPAPAGDSEYFRDMAREICRRARFKDRVSDDEILVLAVVASQSALASYLEPGQCTEQETLSELLGVLDSPKVIYALRGKMADLLAGRISPPRFDAPNGTQVAGLTACDDSEEPATDPAPARLSGSRVKLAQEIAYAEQHNPEPG